MSTSTTDNRALIIAEALANPPYGDEGYYRHWTRRLLYTEAVYHLAEGGGLHWLIDAIASYQGAKLDRECGGMQFWTLTVADDRSAVLECVRDSGETPRVRQRIEYTDCPVPEIKLWVEGADTQRVLLIPAEH